MTNNEKQLSPEQSEEIITVLRERFEKNIDRHPELEWSK